MTFEKWRRENKIDVVKALAEAKAGRYGDIFILYEECWNNGWTEGRAHEKALNKPKQNINHDNYDNL